MVTVMKFQRAPIHPLVPENRGAVFHKSRVFMALFPGFDRCRAPLRTSMGGRSTLTLSAVIRDLLRVPHPVGFWQRMDDYADSTARHIY